MPTGSLRHRKPTVLVGALNRLNNNSIRLPKYQSRALYCYAKKSFGEAFVRLLHIYVQMQMLWRLDKLH